MQTSIRLIPTLCRKFIQLNIKNTTNQVFKNKWAEDLNRYTLPKKTHRHGDAPRCQPESADQSHSEASIHTCQSARWDAPAGPQAKTQLLVQGRGLSLIRKLDSHPPQLRVHGHSQRSQPLWTMPKALCGSQ